MIDSRTRREKELFEAVVDAAPEDRERVLEEGAGGDAELAARVRELLQLFESPSGFLEEPAAGLLGIWSRIELSEGDRIAGYVIEREAGRGGGGVVYEAMQAHPKRRVALKLLDPLGPEEVAGDRFEEEAATLARLRHDGIAHVYASGVHSDGERSCPWIAMELIDGARDLLRHADEEGLDVRARVRLLVRVAEALEHAHGRGVIHRDVKPGNLLVTADGRPKVVDFGIASRAGTRAADVVGTLPYMAREQLDPQVDDLDVRVDVHGLGVVLYQLLAGRLPRQLTATTPSDALREVESMTVAPLRDVAPHVPADLAAAVHRAVATERERRYPSVAAFRRDLERWLAREPVQAYDGGTAYRLRQFVRRRRGLAATVLVVVVATIAVVAVSVRSAVVSERSRKAERFQSYVANVAAAAAALRVSDVGGARGRLLRAPEEYRDWEWAHLWSRTDDSLAQVSWDGRPMWHGSVSSDGTRIAAARPSGDGVDRAAIWDDSGRLLAEIDVTEQREWSVALAPDGSRLALGTLEGGVILFDATTGARLGDVDVADKPLIDIQFAPDGSHVVAPCGDHDVYVLDSATLELLARLKGHTDRAVSVTHAPDGTLVTGSRNGEVRFWDLRTGQATRVLSCHRLSVEGVAISADGTRMATVSRDQTFALWDVATGQRIASGQGHGSNVRDVTFGRDGSWVATASWDGTIRVWDGVTGEERGVLLGHSAPVYALATTPGPRELISFGADGTWRRWDVDRFGVRRVTAPRNAVESVAIEPLAVAERAGRPRLGAAGTRDGRVHLFDLATARPVARTQVGRNSTIRDLAFDGKGRLWACEIRLVGFSTEAAALASGTLTAVHEGPGGYAMSMSDEGPALVLGRAQSLGSLRPTTPRTGRTSGEPAISVRPRGFAMDRSPDGSLVAVGLIDGTVRVVRRGDGTTVSENRVHTLPVLSLEFDGTGARLISASRDGRAAILRLPDLSVEHELAGHDRAVCDAVFFPGGTRAATASLDHTVRIWDVASGEEVLTLHDVGYGVMSLAISDDGIHLAAGGGSEEEVRSNVCIWSAEPLPTTTDD